MKISFYDASERFWFGWGRFGRNRVYEESGRDFSVTDGEWIIRLGIFGFFGFLAEFGLFGLCVFRAGADSKALDFRRDAVFTAALSLIVAISLFDSLPNASLSPWIWLIAGALLGRAEAVPTVSHQRLRSEL